MTSHGREDIFPRLYQELEYIITSIKILQEEFEYRWKCPNQIDESFEENPNSVKFEGKVLQIDFEGWFQCRLPTDPDGSIIKRGVVGNTFAFGNEPDLDRVIRFQKEGTVPRSYTPEIGVKVSRAVVLHSMEASQGNEVMELKDASVQLLDNATFQGRNWMLATDGEYVDPFNIFIQSKDQTISFGRQVVGSGKFVQMAPPQRRGTYRRGRWNCNLATMRKNLSHIHSSSLKEYWADRKKFLEKDRHLTSPDSDDYPTILSRLQDLECANDPKNVRYQRMCFAADYLHSLSGPLTATEAGLSFKVDQDTNKNRNRWLIGYRFTGYDTDALSAYAKGTLWIPLK